MAAVRPAIKTWVSNTAAKYKGKEINEMVLKVTENFAALGNFTPTDIDALCFLAIMQVSKNERASKNATSIIKNKSPEKANTKATSIKDMSEETQLQLQTSMDGQSKYVVLLSNILKKGGVR